MKKEVKPLVVESIRFTFRMYHPFDLIEDKFSKGNKLHSEISSRYFYSERLASVL